MQPFTQLVHVFSAPAGYLTRYDPEPAFAGKSTSIHWVVTGAYQMGERFNSPSDTSRLAPADRVALTPGPSLVLSHP